MTAKYRGPSRGERVSFARSCETLCDDQAQQAYDDCIALGGTPVDCESEAESVRQACLESECGPPCHALCRQQSDQAFVECRDGGGAIEDCAQLSRQILWDCLKNECGVEPPPPSGPYASFSELGLQQDDDIDGLVVFDEDGDGVFNSGDHVLFSLTPDSPSLATIAGASSTGAAADIFVVTPARQSPTLFVAASALGLGHADDNIDALDYTPCLDAEGCAATHGIRSEGPIPTLSVWGMITMALLLITAASVVMPTPRPTDQSRVV